jgi:hypothetical protein
MTARDANAYAKDLVRAALWGSGAYHPDGRYIHDLKRIARLSEAVNLLSKLEPKVSSADGSNAIKHMREHIQQLGRAIEQRRETIENGRYSRFPIVKVPDWSSRRWKKNVDRNKHLHGFNEYFGYFE